MLRLAEQRAGKNEDMVSSQQGCWAFLGSIPQPGFMVCAAENPTDREEEASPEEKGGRFRKGTEPTTVRQVGRAASQQVSKARLHSAQPDKAEAPSLVLHCSCRAPLPQLPPLQTYLGVACWQESPRPGCIRFCESHSVGALHWVERVNCVSPCTELPDREQTCCKHMLSLQREGCSWLQD